MEVATINQSCPAHILDLEQRKDLALKLISNDDSVSNMSRDNKVSRKFLYQQKDKALQAIDAEFREKDDDEVLFNLPVTKSWLSSFVLCLLLHCRSSKRGVQKVFHDALDHSISIGTIYNIESKAEAEAMSINASQDLSNINTAIPDELYHNDKPILSGVDAKSLYCYLLSQESHRDGDTWAIHLLDCQEQGLNPDRFIADDGSGLRAGHKTAYNNIPVDGDTFHIIKSMLETRLYFRNKYATAVTAWIDLADKMDNARLKGKGNKYSRKLNIAAQHEEDMFYLTQNIETLVSWMQMDVLQSAGLSFEDRSELYDFIVSEFKALEVIHSHRLKELRTSLENQKNQILGFVQVLEYAFHRIAVDHNVSEQQVWEMCSLLRCQHGSDKYSIRCIPLLTALGDERFDALEDAVIEALGTTEKTSSMIENFNSRIRPYLFLRKIISNDYLGLLRFYFNHTPFLRSKHEYRQGKTAAEVMTGKAHPHWLEMLGLTKFTKAAA